MGESHLGEGEGEKVIVASSSSYEEMVQRCFISSCPFCLGWCGTIIVAFQFLDTIVGIQLCFIIFCVYACVCLYVYAFVCVCDRSLSMGKRKGGEGMVRIWKLLTVLHFFVHFFLSAGCDGVSCRWLSH